MTIFSWILFAAVVTALLCLDLLAHNRSKGEKSLRHALFWSGIWIALSLLFNVWIYFSMGLEPALNFLAGYLIEKMLSLDNLFVFLLIFEAFHIAPEHRHRVLFWGVKGALIMRGLFIAGGIALVSSFTWVLTLFGAFLIAAGIKLAFQKEKKFDPRGNPLILGLQKFIPILPPTDDGRFFIKQGGKWFATSLFLALLAIETSDLIFAIDSIPAIFGITTDPLIVFTSNIFAVLGLRSLYFVLEKLASSFRYLHYGLSAVLVFIGAKMLLADFFHPPVWSSLVIIVLLIGLSLGASLVKKAAD